jgi:protein phosphatase 1 regulatory subunit 7
MEVKMKKLLVVLSLFSIINVQAAGAASLSWVQTSDNQVMQIPTTTFPLIHNAEDDYAQDPDGQSTRNNPLLLPMVDSHHLKHAIRLSNFDGRHYKMPVTHEELKAQNVTLPGLLKALDFMQAKNMVEKFYTAWLNHPQNRDAAVHHNVPASVVLNQMGLDTKDIPDIGGNISLKGDLKNKIKGYKNRQLAHVSIQNLLDADKISRFGYGDLDLSNKHITSLNGLHNMIGIENVTQIRIHDNLLTTIQPNAFHNLPELKSINLSNNLLTTLQPNAFHNLPQLELLELNNNQLTTLQPNVFNNLPVLEELTLNNNQLTTLQPGVFNNLPQLYMINLDNNKLTTIQPGVFHNLTQLVSLTFNSNQLDTIQRYAFHNLPELKILELSINKLAIIQPDVFLNLPALQRLHISSNAIFTAEQKEQIENQVPANCIISFE